MTDFKGDAMEKRELELRAAMQLLMSASARVLCDAGAQEVFTPALLAVVNELKPKMKSPPNIYNGVSGKNLGMAEKTPRG